MVAHPALSIGRMLGRLGVGHSHSQGYGCIHGGDLLVGTQVGIPSLSAAVVILVGLFGAVLGFKVMDYGRVKSPIAQGLSMGTASHAIGTSTAMDISRKYGAYASLGLTLNGILTALLAPTALRLLGII